MIKKIFSSIFGCFLGLLIIAPPIDYSIPLLINSFQWLYIVCVSGFMGLLTLSQDISAWIKVLTVYLFAGCFISQAPASSFNAYILVVFAIYLFMAIKKCDFGIVVSFIEAAFWFQVVLCCFQLAGIDKLLCFDRAFRLDPKTLSIVAISGDSPKYIAFGTVMQYMRFGSVIAVMTPLLVSKSRLYLIPIGILCVINQSSSFALSVLSGVGAYALLCAETKGQRGFLLFLVCLGLLGFALYDIGSWRGAIISSNGGRLVSWWAAIQTWVLDTSTVKDVAHLNGPFKWNWFLFGHGMDTFLALFPIYKHDPNPFPQAHNDFIQLLWECGQIGFSIVAGYCTTLIYRLYRLRDYQMISGLAVIATAMFFTFPMRMTQTVFLIVAFLALCEKRICEATLPEAEKSGDFQNKNNIKRSHYEKDTFSGLSASLRA